MDLIQNIDNTDSKKNNLKKVSKKINNEIFNLTGENIINLSSVPNKLDKAIKSLVKIAKIELNHKYTMNAGSTKKISIPINLNFVPRFIYVEVECTFSNEIAKHGFCWSKDLQHNQAFTTFGFYGYVEAYIDSVDRSEVSFSAQNTDNETHALIFKKIIAIS